MPRLTQADLAPLNKTLEERTPQELLSWASTIFGDRLAILSAMQLAGSIVCHMVSTAKLQIPVLFVDTGVNFPETLDTRDRLISEQGLRVITLHPELTMTEQTKRHGVLYLTPEGQKECCHMRKIEPLLTARGQYDGIIGSLRRAEGGRRGGVPILALDPDMNAVRVNVLANMTDEQMAEYLANHNVIVNPLHDQGFTTISCNRCTTPVLPNEPPRAGRWRHLGPWSAYCHINPTDRDGANQQGIDLEQDVINRLFGRETDFAI